MEVYVKPGYDDCCGCIDMQITTRQTASCDECCKARLAECHSFVRDKGKAYGIISYPNGSLDCVELYRLKAKKE